MKKLDLPPVWLAGFILLAWLFGRAGSAGGWSAWSGGLWVLAGLALIAWALWTMFQARTTPIPNRQPTTLVIDGPFNYSRNPIYLGDALVLAGLCLRWEVMLGVILVPAFVAVIQVRFVQDEEARLRETFGQDYEDWASQVRAWV